MQQQLQCFVQAAEGTLALQQVQAPSPMPVRHIQFPTTRSGLPQHSRVSQPPVATALLVTSSARQAEAAEVTAHAGGVQPNPGSVPSSSLGFVSWPRPLGHPTATQPRVAWPHPLVGWPEIARHPSGATSLQDTAGVPPVAYQYQLMNPAVGVTYTTTGPAVGPGAALHGSAFGLGFRAKPYRPFLVPHEAEQPPQRYPQQEPQQLPPQQEPQQDPQQDPQQETQQYPQQYPQQELQQYPQQPPQQEPQQYPQPLPPHEQPGPQQGTANPLGAFPQATQPVAQEPRWHEQLHENDDQPGVGATALLLCLQGSFLLIGQVKFSPVCSWPGRAEG